MIKTTDTARTGLDRLDAFTPIAKNIMKFERYDGAVIIIVVVIAMKELDPFLKARVIALHLYSLIVIPVIIITNYISTWMFFFMITLQCVGIFRAHKDEMIIRNTDQAQISINDSPFVKMKDDRVILMIKKERERMFSELDTARDST